MNLSRLICLGTVLVWGQVLRADDYSTVIRKDSPVLHWPFDKLIEGADKSSTLVDKAGFAKGRVVATAQSRHGVNGAAVAFDRLHRSGRVDAVLNADRNKKLHRILNASFTIELWFLDEAPEADGKTNSSLFYKADAKKFTSNSMWLYRARQTGHYHFLFRETAASNDPKNWAGVTIKNPAGLKAAGDRLWHHLAIAVDRSSSPATITAFLDAKVVAEKSFPPTTRIENNGPLRIGNSIHLGSPWIGLIDEFAIYDRTLSKQQIDRHYQAGRNSLKQSSLVALNSNRTRPGKAKPMQMTLAEKEQFFELKVRPLLVEKCAGCHSGEADAESKLGLASRRELVDGGDFGPAIFPGRAEDSLLVHAVKRTHKELHMPPDKSDALSRAEVATLARWIDAGAIWPGDTAKSASPSQKVVIENDEKLRLNSVEDWAFLPRKKAQPPVVEDSRWSNSAIDRFLQAERQKHGVQARGRADRRTLIRRASFDLLGLPPSPAAVEKFVNDPADDLRAWANLIDGMLDSKHYGERAGRLWLDVARYADTQGDVGDFPIQTAWLYRNWVIDALNSDMPYDQFIQAQVAGDILAASIRDKKKARELTIATGFISLSRRFGNTKKDDIHLTIEDTIDTVGRAVLGLTLRCARCHDHKFDPILNSDYYGLYGIFASTIYPWMGMSNEKSPSDLSPAVPSKQAVAKSREYWALITRYEYQINNHFRPWLKPALEEYKRVDDELRALGNNKKAKAQGQADKVSQLRSQREKLLSFRGGRFRELMLHGLNWIKSEKTRLAENPPFEFVFAVSEGKPRDARVHKRGNPRQLGAVAKRRFLQAVDGGTLPNIPRGSGRLELARWMTDPKNPLTARVFVNRVWQQHFGKGLVTTPDNFGRQGMKPTHPELLDWLAERFITDGWSIKKLHRRIMLSESYQLGSTGASGNFNAKELDVENTWITRYPRRRLDAESIRDAMLAVSGELDRSPAKGHPMKPWYQSRYSLNSPFHLEPNTKRRSVYLLTQRLFRHSILDLFDGPDRNSSTSGRSSSNVPSQALFLMNSSFVRERAIAFARSLQGFEQTTTLITQAYRRAYSRNPSSDEITLMTDFLANYRSARGKDDVADKAVDPALVALSRVILTSNEFFFFE